MDLRNVVNFSQILFHFQYILVQIYKQFCLQSINCIYKYLVYTLLLRLRSKYVSDSTLSPFNVFQKAVLNYFGAKSKEILKSLSNVQ